MNADEMRDKFNELIAEVRFVWLNDREKYDREHEVIDYFEVRLDQIVEEQRKDDRYEERADTEEARMAERDELEANRDKVTWHNHMTRDIKPLGECPGCDFYHSKQMEADSW